MCYSTTLFTCHNTISISNIYLLLLHHIYNIIIFFHSFRQHYSPNSFSAIIVGFYWAIKKLFPWLSPENPAVDYFVIHNTISYSREHKLIIKLLMIIMIITFQVCTHSWSHSPGWGWKYFLISAVKDIWSTRAFGVWNRITSWFSIQNNWISQNTFNIFSL